MNDSIHPHTMIGSVRLKVSNLERSIHFYRETIGFNILTQEPTQATLTADGTTPLVLLEQRDGALPKPPRTTGLYHFAILVPDRRSLARSLRHLIEQEYPLQGASDHQFSEAIYLADPDKNGIEIYADRPVAEWEKKENGEYKGITRPLDLEGLLAKASPQSWTGLPAATRIGHIHLHVPDLSQADHFYRRGLGFDVTIRMQNHALFMSAGGYHHHIGLNTWAGVGAPPPPANAVGLQLFSIVLPDENAFERVQERLHKIGIPMHRRQHSGFVQDPAGNGIQLSYRSR